MKKLLILSICFFTISTLTAQTIKSEPLGVFKNNKTVIFIDENGKETIKMPTQFTYNKQLRKHTKVVELEGELYHIIREKKEQLVYKKGGELIARIDKKSKAIHLLESDQRFVKGFDRFKSAYYYTNELGEKVVFADFLHNRVYKLSTKLEDFEANKLLMVLNLHQFLEFQRQREGLTDLLVLGTIF